MDGTKPVLQNTASRKAAPFRPGLTVSTDCAEQTSHPSRYHRGRRWRQGPLNHGSAFTTVVRMWVFCGRQQPLSSRFKSYSGI